MEGESDSGAMGRIPEMRSKGGIRVINLLGAVIDHGGSVDGIAGSDVRA